MAQILTLPNFFASAKPVQSDFNNAAKSFVQQLGGEYYDEGLTAYVVLPGGLDATNLLSSGPGFRNSQKLEGRSVSSVSGIATVSAGAFTNLLSVGPFLFDCTIVGIGLQASDGTYYISGGSFSVYLNTIPLIAIAVGSGGGSTISGVNGDPSYVTTSIQVRMGDMVTIDPTNGTNSPSSPLIFSNVTRVQGSVPASVAPTSDLNISLYTVSAHSK